MAQAGKPTSEIAHPTEETSGLGPRGEARRRAWLDAADKLFAQKGYANTTLSDLVAAGGGSRTVLYDYFGGKSGLLRMVLVERNRALIAELDRVRPNPDEEPREALTRVARRFLGYIVNPDKLGMLRILITEREELADVGAFFMENGPNAVTARISEYLADLASGGRLRIEHPQRAARIFLDMIIGVFVIRQMIVPDHPITPDEIDQKVTSAVDLFLLGVLPR